MEGGDRRAESCNTIAKKKKLLVHAAEERGQDDYDPPFRGPSRATNHSPSSPRYHVVGGLVAEWVDVSARTMGERKAFPPALVFLSKRSNRASTRGTSSLLPIRPGPMSHILSLHIWWSISATLGSDAQASVCGALFCALDMQCSAICTVPFSGGT